jgi:hypothetical protein
MDQEYEIQGDKVATILSMFKEESNTYTKTKKKDDR